MTAGRKQEVFDFLSGLEFRFEDVNFSEEVDFSKTGTFYVRYEGDDFLIIGLKLLAEAQTHINAKYYQFSNAFMRGGFYSFASLKPTPASSQDSRTCRGQTPDVKEWVLALDKFLTDNSCKVVGDYNSFTYTQKAKK